MATTETLNSAVYERADPAVDRCHRKQSRLCTTKAQRIGLAMGIVLIVVVPLSVPSDFLISLGVTVGIYAIAAVGLNVLSGYAGQISLAQSVFVGIGAFAGVAFGSLIQLPLILWLPGSVVAGGLIAALVAPLTLRLKGVFQIVLSLGLIFIGHYIFVNVPAITGGNSGISAAPSLSLGFVDFGALRLGGMQYSYERGLFILVWLCLAACMIAVVNMNRTRFGRSMIAIREADTAAGIAGININSVKVKTFIIAGALGGLAGGLLLAQLRFVQVDQFNILMGLELLVIVVVGGLGTTWGPVIGSLIVSSIPILATQYGAHLPFLKPDFDQTGQFGVPVGQVGVLVYGLALVMVMRFEPRGAAHWIKSAARTVSGRGTRRVSDPTRQD